MRKLFKKLLESGKETTWIAEMVTSNGVRYKTELTAKTRQKAYDAIMEDSPKGNRIVTLNKK